MVHTTFIKDLDKMKNQALKSIVLALIIGIIFISTVNGEQGKYFSKKSYEAKPLPKFEDTLNKLPRPIFEENNDYVECYYKAWEIAFRNFYEPLPSSGFVSQYIDAAFSDSIFLWDTCFMTMFCNYAHPHVPGVCSLDNFYARQYETGEICREINRKTGDCLEFWLNKENEPLFSRWGFDWEKGSKKVNITYQNKEAPKPNPVLTLDSLNHPIFAWAEIESYKITGDKKRLEQVWEPLVQYYSAMKKYVSQGNGLYMTDSASMDNSTRNEHLYGGGTAIDTSAEMVLFARNLSQIAGILNKKEAACKYKKEAAELSKIINEKMWDNKNKFYYDLMLNGNFVPVKTVAGFWTLLAEVATKDNAKALVAELENPKTFKTAHRVPTLAADQNNFNPQTGYYWRGAVWAPTNTMVIKGLEKYGYNDLAQEIALNHLDNVIKVYKETGTVWENYAPQKIAKGDPSRKDFVGWSGISPISYFIEYKIGIRADAIDNSITWKINSPKTVGIENFWFGGKTVSLLCSEVDNKGKRQITVKSDGDFKLKIKINNKTKKVNIKAAKEKLIQI
jgi:hypothetical protein